VDRYWLLTWTTYGSWLPGDPRGFVSEQVDASGTKFIHNTPGTDYDAGNRRLRDAMLQRLKGSGVRLSVAHAEVLRNQFLETATVREWRLLAISIMANHIHLVVGVRGDPDHSRILGDFKSYASRALNRIFGRPGATAWWTESGSKRKLPRDDSVLAAVRYVRDQEYSLLVWLDPQIANEISEGRPEVRDA
jgi:REP element-mobilizing transposase RayT